MRTLFTSLMLVFASCCFAAAETHKPATIPSPAPFDGAKILYQWDWACDAPNCILSGPLIGPAGDPIQQGKQVSIWLVAMPSGGANSAPTYFVYLPQSNTWLVSQISSNFNFMANHLNLKYAGVP
jgi:hypothetical protein